MQVKKSAAADTLGHLADLHKQGRWNDIIAAAQNYISAQGPQPNLTYFLGLALGETGDYVGATHWLQESLAASRSFQTLIALSGVYTRRDAPQNAIPLLFEALKLQPRSADALCALGTAYMDLDQYDKAETMLTHAGEIDPACGALFNLGLLNLRIAKPDVALKFFTRSVEQNEKDLQNWEYLAQTYFLQGQYVHAVLIFHKLASENPDNLRMLHLLSVVLREFKPVKSEPVFRDALKLCLDEKRLSQDNLNGFFIALVNTDPAYANFQKMLAAKTYSDFLHIIQGVNLSSFFDSLFIAALSAFNIRDVRFERCFIFLRRYFLERTTSDAASMETLLPLIAGMATQSFLNEYIYDQTPEERTAADTLAARLKSQKHWTIENAIHVLVFASYRPLITIAAETPLLSPGNIDAAADIPALAIVLADQVTDIRREREIEKDIPSLTPSSDATSHKVREMYEENPYPRWKNVYCEPGSINPFVDMAALHRNATNGKLNVLNAGCGTGRHIVISQANFPGADILGVDLSLASLSFAKKRCLEYGLSNVTLMQADILELGGIGRQFDIIDSTGVLHHMADPMRGWRVLTGLLKPGGYMRIGLYSELARKDVVACRDFIAKNGFEPTLDGIRACRRALLDLPPSHPAYSIRQTMDFFTTSMCRDLIFHVQEHRFTIPQIEACLKELGLEMTSFNISDSQILYDYRMHFPEDQKLASLKNWHQYEQKHPATFANMYQFWCHKPAS